ncbi:MAG TPA: tetratricopeptide repeat protein [Termitinemataceae bacterium]|uniref:tetratricopeptide repeat protein n=1 Tax=Treponema sp. J25 TaxID=2094121 RepID=UPI001049B4D5|nr:tetratricopeptide repeat protein [Treponema sp. J25]TCW62256.1 hypothetical protein C5O22_01945 [Treponema sp. J25]HOJ98852.1 tetratricopeptide repeat protein [Termitinemataceae bacterium]HOM22563.1 tetratricopeptide repeat protein [Termitinemataceae bacterium]HPQ00081.1 tetratricopeptide repeat protein [Termitinemataceae bacterium]
MIKTEQYRQQVQRALQKGKERDYPAAITILEELLYQSDEGHPEVLLLLGRAYHAIKEYGRALAAFREVIQMQPEDAAGYFFAGRTYLSMGMAQEAVWFLKKAKERNPEDYQILALLGIACLKARRSGEAVELLQQAVERGAGNSPRIYRAYLNALLVRGIKLCRNGEPDLGSQMLRFVIENGLNTPLPHLELGRVYREEGRLQEALYHYEEASRLAPQDTSIRWYRASLLMALGKSDEARREIERLRTIDEDIPHLSWTTELIDRCMIRSFIAEGAWQRVVQACGSFLRRYGPDPMVHAMYAEALRNLGNFETARNHLERAIELAPRQIELRYASLILSWQEENWQDLQKNLEVLKRLGGDPLIIQRFQALLHAQWEEDDKRVISELQQAIRDGGPSPELMFSLAERYLKVGLPELAMGWYHKTRQILPHYERAYLGELAAREAALEEGLGGSSEELEQCYEEYLSLWPDNWKIRREYALYLIKSKKYEIAQRELQNLLVRETNNDSLKRLLAYTYRKTGKYREAAVLLKKLLQKNLQDTNLLFEFVFCLERSGARPYAYLVLEKAQHYYKNSFELFIKLGDLAYELHHIEKALDAYRAAAHLKDEDPLPYQRMAHIYRKQGIHEMALRYEQEAQKRENRHKNPLPS